MNLAVGREAEIEEADCLVGGSSGQELIHCGVEGQGVDSIGVSVLEDDGGLGVALCTKVHELDGKIVRNRSKEVLAVSRVPLHIVDCGTVVVELTSRVERLCLKGEVARQIPQIHDLIFTT